MKAMNQQKLQVNQMNAPQNGVYIVNQSVLTVANNS